MLPAADDERELDARSACTSTISRAIASTRFGSTPYSCSPISASPESLSRTRRNGGPRPRRPLGLGLRCHRRHAHRRARGARTRRTSRARLGERLADRLRRVVDPRLLGEHTRLRAKKRLLSMPSTIFSRACSGFDCTSSELSRSRARPRRPRPGTSSRVVHCGRREGDVHRELPRELRRAAAQLDEHADLVRGRVDVRVDDLAVARPRSARRRRRRCSRRAWRRARRAPPRATRPRSGPSASTASSTFFANARNSSFFETGSVSQPTATIVPRAVVDRGSRRCPRSSRGRRACRPGPCRARAGACARPRCRRPSPRARACSPSSPRRSRRGAP